MIKGFCFGIIFVFAMQFNLFASQTEDRFSRSEDPYFTVDKPVKPKEDKSKKPKTFTSIGFTGGYNFGGTFSEVSSLPDSLKIGMVFSSKKDVEGLPTRQLVNFIGFMSGSSKSSNFWGMSFAPTMHKNYSLKNDCYFYTGYGLGFDFYIHDNTRYDINLQLARCPIGFKVLMMKTAEIFFEATMYVGILITGKMGDVYVNNTSFSYGTELNGGVRFWF